jgi:hypothetical protein
MSYIWLQAMREPNPDQIFSFGSLHFAALSVEKSRSS